MILGQIKELYKNNGLRYLLLRIVHRFFSLLGIYWEVSYALCQKINIIEVDEYLKNHTISNYNFGKLHKNDFKNADLVVSDNKKRALIKRRLNKVETFIPFGVKDGDKLIYLAWASLNQWELDYGIGGPMQNRFLLLDDFCAPAYRRSGIHLYMIYYRLKTIYELGFKDTMVFVHKNNMPALKSQIKAGFVIKKTCLSVKFFGKTKLFVF